MCKAGKRRTVRCGLRSWSPCHVPGAWVWLFCDTFSSHSWDTVRTLPMGPSGLIPGKAWQLGPQRSWGAPGVAESPVKTHFGVVFHLRPQKLEVDATQLSISLTQVTLSRRRKEAGVSRQNICDQRPPARISFSKNVFFPDYEHENLNIEKDIHKHITLNLNTRSNHG